MKHLIQCVGRRKLELFREGPHLIIAVLLGDQNKPLARLVFEPGEAAAMKKALTTLLKKP